MFAGRVDAGRRLADRLQRLRGQDGVVLGLPRGGVPVALEVAQALDAPLEVIVVRKLGVPPERAELERRARRFRGDRPRVALAGKTAVVHVAHGRAVGGEEQVGIGRHVGDLVRVGTGSTVVDPHPQARG
jgi:putative phosphoribosyl transferase